MINEHFAKGIKETKILVFIEARTNFTCSINSAEKIESITLHQINKIKIAFPINFPCAVNFNTGLEQWQIVSIKIHRVIHHRL